LTTIPPGEDEILDLVRRCNAGEDTAWEAFYSRCSRNLPPCIRSFRLPPDWIGEIVPDFVCHLFEDECQVLRTYRPQPPSRFDSWLRVCFRNFTRKWLKRRFLPRWDPSIDPASILEEGSVPCEDPYVLLGISRVFDQLDEREGRLLSLRLAGFPHREIGERLSMEEGHVGVAMQRMRDHLRVLLTSQVLDLDPPGASNR
jgi:RNA polymerase sigma factor (sigma-70 family)